jgi:primosomal protein N' (replication factor Y) (superfamily II helicase)
MKFVKVIVPLFLPKALDYQYVDGEPTVGEFVSVNVGKAFVEGVIAQVKDSSDYTGKLKNARPTGFFLAPETLEFFDWINKYNIAFPGESLRACLTANRIPEDKSYKDALFILNENADKITKHRQIILDFLKTTKEPYSKIELSKHLEVSSSVIKTMLEKGFLEEKNIKLTVEETAYTSNIDKIELTEQQSMALNRITACIDAKTFNPILLDGVTGSGKTEVFFKAMDKVLKQGLGQILVMVPEISLTPQLLERFEKHFGFKPYGYHSNMTATAKAKTWHKVLNGEAKVVIGARSALFLPFKKLKFIVVDEEHDNSYKQEDNFKYHGRDMAIVRAKLGNFTIVLASATPSLQTWYNAQTQKFSQIIMPSRYGVATLPDIKMIDMKNENAGTDKFISPTLKSKLAKNLEEKNQSLVFLNRRGNAPLLICKTCGHRHTCPSCDVYMVVHGNKMVCHHCGFKEPYPDACASCGKEESLFAFGVGTRKLYTEIQEYFQNARIGLADTDNIKSNKEMAELIKQIENNEIDILIGTQMIAKGLNFKDLTLVGVVDADMGLNNSDLRAGEQTFQLISQVAGRAGRYDKKGTVYLQSYMPEHEIFDYLKDLDRDGYFNLELKSRKFGNLPPFSKLTAILIKSKNQQSAQYAASKLVQNFPNAEGIQVLGPAPATLFKIRDIYRFRILIKSNANLHKQIKHWIATTQVSNDVRIDIDIDPQTLY